jgi:hypothetical protein
MDPVSNTDRLVRLLRQKLEERGRAKKREKTAGKQPIRLDGLEHVRAVAGEIAQAGADDRQLNRLLIEQLLSDQFGPGLINEPRFQQIVEQVAEMMAGDPVISALLSQASAEIRSKGV